jgi:hypothetical protein
MPMSQFNSPGTLRPDGTVQLTGTVDLPGDDAVEIRFLIVQGDLIVAGKGQGQGGGGWSGGTDHGQDELQEGQVLAIGLGLVARAAKPGTGFQTVTWSAQIELERRAGDDH